MARSWEAHRYRKQGQDRKGSSRHTQHERNEPPRRTSPPEEAIERVANRSARTRPVRRLLEGIGTPEPAPFTPDPFQLEALTALEHQDVLVTAPTGSGKTWIAREEIRRLLQAGRRA